MKKKGFLFLPLLLIAGCAGSPGWVNPDVPKERWSRDLAACRRDADATLGVGDRYEPDDRSSMPGRMLDREDTRRRFDSHVRACMEAGGYRRAP